MSITVCRRRVLLALGGPASASAMLQTFMRQPVVTAQAQPAEGPLPSWNDGRAKQQILEFARATTDASEPSYVPPEDRVATFDQDGTLLVEHPMYTQAMFALEREQALASAQSEGNSSEPFKSKLPSSPEALAQLTEADWTRFIGATHAWMSDDAFHDIAEQWLASAKHPNFRRLYTELVYQPMLEVIEYLRNHDFRTYIVTGGGQEFVRVYSRNAYGIPEEHVVGSSIQTAYQSDASRPMLMRMPMPFFVDDKAGKPIGINQLIGTRPLAAFGNSDGDREMLEWAGAGAGARLLMLVHHDDQRREFAYGPASSLPDTSIGRFSDSLMTEASSRGWTVISMRRDWNRVFAWE
jgi:phosphoserine phosphatase